jgi:hypothetical protein
MRNIADSPIELQVYPGDVVPETSTSYGAGLQHCTALNQCSFETQARDVESNNAYTNGHEDWETHMNGVNGWAGLADSSQRINDYIYPGVTNVVISTGPNDWSIVGTGSIMYESTDLQLNTKTAVPVARGDTLLIGTQKVVVDDEGILSDLNVPLKSMYLGKDLVDQTIYKIVECETGKYTSTYTPKVKGTYEINVMQRKKSEKQTVKILADSRLGGSFKISVDTFGTTDTTGPLSLPTTEASIKAALESLVNVGMKVNVIETNKTDNEIIFDVEFDLEQDIPPLRLDVTDTVGDELVTSVIQIEDGAPATNIRNSPWFIYVAPDIAVPAYTTAFGQGLIQSVTHKVANFTVQAKDGYGNNRDTNQTLETFLMLAYKPTTSASVDGWISPSEMGEGLYDAYYTAYESGQYNVIVMMATKLEVQNISTSWTYGSQTMGTFWISTTACTSQKNCNRTRNLNWNAPASEVENALMQLPIGTVKVIAKETTDKLNRAWELYFETACDVVDLFVHSDTGMPISIGVPQQGECEHIKTSASQLPFPWNGHLLVEEKQRVQLEFQDLTGEFSISYRQHTMYGFTPSSSAVELRNAFRELAVVGDVDIDITDSSNTKISFDITFKPSAGYSRDYLETFGDLDKVMVSATNNSVLVVNSVTELQKGRSPFAAYVTAEDVSAEHSTAIDFNGVAGYDGLHKGIYESVTRFYIESRDESSNRVLNSYPRVERQILELTCPSGDMFKDTASFTMSYLDGEPIVVAGLSSVAHLELQLQDIAHMSGSTVMTNSARLLVTEYKLRVNKGETVVYLDKFSNSSQCDQLINFIPSDWSRIKDEHGPIYAVTRVEKEKCAIHIDGP